MNIKRILILITSLFLFSYSLGISQIKLVVLGTLQDAGSPHIACVKNCCKELFEKPDQNRKVVSLGVFDEENKMNWIFDATPDLPQQMKLLKQFSSFSKKETPDGIFLTHAHIGHYIGLMYLGKEAMGSKKMPVYAMPKMKSFLESNGPWSQLVKLDNIILEELENEKPIELTNKLTVIPHLVPHRDEYSETVGFIIKGVKKKALFIPDIDKWKIWNKNILNFIDTVDYAFLDATFYDGAEVNNRDISEIPHPFVIESMDLFKNLSQRNKNKIYFIHFNHTNPLLNKKSEQYKSVIEKGFNVAEYKQVFVL